jgi:hypothetical protein
MLKDICNGYDALINSGILHLNLSPKTLKYCGKKVKIGDFWFSHTHTVDIHNTSKTLYTGHYSSP